MLVTIFRINERDGERESIKIHFYILYISNGHLLYGEIDKIQNSDSELSQGPLWLAR